MRLALQNYSNWWLILFPSLAMFFTVTVFNLVGSGLRDAMDPRLVQTRLRTLLNPSAVASELPLVDTRLSSAASNQPIFFSLSC